MSDMIIKVTPEEVQEKAKEILNQEKNMEELMNEMQAKVNELEQYVKTSAGESYLDHYVSVRKNISNSLDVISKHVSNLNEAAARYIDENNRQERVAKQLSTESIF